MSRWVAAIGIILVLGLVIGLGIEIEQLITPGKDY